MVDIIRILKEYVNEKFNDIFEPFLEGMKEELFDPILTDLTRIQGEINDFFASILKEFKKPNGKIHMMMNNLPEIIVKAFKLNELVGAINEIFKLMFTILTGFIPFLGKPIINLFKSAFGWAFDPINYIFSSGYNFFISGCYVCILIQTFGIFLELYSIARIIAG